MLQTFSITITNKVNYFASIFTDRKKIFSCIVNHFVHFGVIVSYEDNTNTYGIPNLDCLLGMVYQQQLALLGDTLKESEKASESQSQRNTPTCALEESIVNKILTLPPETILLSDHSSPITVEQERRLLLG